MPLLIFQSTPPARGATHKEKSLSRIVKNFNPRPPRGGRRVLTGVFALWLLRFQSTPPARGATTGKVLIFSEIVISIHAPREGGDDGSLLR